MSFKMNQMQWQWQRCIRRSTLSTPQHWSRCLCHLDSQH